MDLRDFITLTLRETDGEVRGKTKFQKLIYFVGVLTNNLDLLGYRAHFYGPYSDQVAYAVGQLRSIGVIDQNETDWGIDRRGFEVKRYDYRLSEAGKTYAETLANRYPKLSEQIRRAIEAYRNAGDLEYMDLSIAAKTYFLLGQRNGKPSLSELVSLAPRFGWNVEASQIEQAARYLQRLGLVEVES